jgi:hypothetical protein
LAKRLTGRGYIAVNRERRPACRAANSTPDQVVQCG